jgi:tricarballylate dehydrogenase
MLTTACRRNGIDILYETKMLRLVQDSRGGVSGVIVKDADGVHEIGSGGVVLACGGFEANAEMRVKYLGAGWESARVRGSKYNTGDGHRAALEVGAKAAGQWTGCHATPIDVNAPATGDPGITERMPRRAYPLGISVNLGGRRFVDEGEGFAEQTFVKVGRRILEQERSMAYQIFDAKAAPVLEPRYGVSKAVEADSVEELAGKLGINPTILATTVDNFNAEAHDGAYAPRELDGRATRTLDPPKSNWAIKLDSPPFVAHAVTGGITYTYGGPKIDTTAQVQDMEDNPIPGLFAAGEIVGGILFHNSLRGGGLMHGAVFGKLAGANAAKGA